MGQKQKVIVGMSGGVDSSVTAALLLQEGYDVIGITMQLLAKEDIQESACCNLDAVCDAKRVAQNLGIPHYTINIRDTFKKNVIDPFVSQYMAGYTPNPCVECNRHIKFTELYKVADDLGADLIATGHYCKRLYDEKEDVYRLEKARDHTKDQSYFLYMLTHDQLKNIIFPLGDYTKQEIRAIARDLNLINADRPESQDICFVSQKSYTSFIKKNVDIDTSHSGDIVGTDGAVLGQHDGLYQFTIGQRKGLGIASNDPLYVLALDPQTNSVTVGQKSERVFSEFAIQTFSKVNPKESCEGATYSCRLRYQMTPIQATVVTESEGDLRISLATGESEVTPGQSAVFYDGDRVVGGGIISR